jgi:hypothetical protein
MYRISFNVNDRYKSRYLHWARQSLYMDRIHLMSTNFLQAGSERLNEPRIHLNPGGVIMSELNKRLDLAADHIASYEEDLKNATLNEEERSNFWKRVDRLKWDLGGLGNLFQNPITITQEQLKEWSWLVENLRRKLLELQQDVAKATTAKI